MQGTLRDLSKNPSLLTQSDPLEGSEMVSLIFSQQAFLVWIKKEKSLKKVTWLTWLFLDASATAITILCELHAQSDFSRMSWNSFTIKIFHFLIIIHFSFFLPSMYLLSWLFFVSPQNGASAPVAEELLPHANAANDHHSSSL